MHAPQSFLRGGAWSCVARRPHADASSLRIACAQILDDVIKHRWGAIDDEQRAGIRNYISNLIIKISSDEATFRTERVFLNKLNIILVQVGAAWGCCAGQCRLRINVVPPSALCCDKLCHRPKCTA